MSYSPNSSDRNGSAGAAAYQQSSAPAPKKTSFSEMLSILLHDKGSIAAIIMLFVPVLRIIGGFMLFKRILRIFHINGKNLFWLILIIFLLAGGALGEILGLIKKLSIPLTVVAAAGIFLFGYLKKSQTRFDEYLSYIGDKDAVSIDALTGALDISEAQLRKDVATMRSKKLLPKTAYVDLKYRLLVINEAGRPKEQSEAQPKPSNPVHESKAEQIRPEETQFDLVLKEIRHLNDEIKDESLSMKIDHIEHTTAGIFSMIRQHPDCVKDAQTFLEYYLPTTLKLLARYAELERQGDYAGENVRQSKMRIENVMDKVMEGFDIQLDRLYKSEAMDINTDVNALEKMMRMEGLGKK